MRALVTTKGQVTISKELREKCGIKPGSEVDFVAGSDGIRCPACGFAFTKRAKWSIRSKRFAVLGCLKNELAGRSVEKLMDDRSFQY